MSRVEGVIPGAPQPDWWYRMFEQPTFRNCENFTPFTPDGFDKLWTCCRREGHTGRHFGLATVHGDMTQDSWVVWS